MTRIQPFPAPCAEKARAALPRPAGTAVFMLTHEARSALCGRFGLEDSQLDRALRLLGAARVEDPDVPHGPIEADAAELLARLAEDRLPWFIHACPRWAARRTAPVSSAFRLFYARTPRAMPGARGRGRLRGAKSGSGA